jgi:methionyl-tRNA formyltransferase
MGIGLIEMSIKSLDVVFFGNNLKILDCLNAESNICAVFTRPDDGTNEHISSVRKYSVSKNIPVFQPTKKELYVYTGLMHDICPDLIVVCGYKYIIPKEIFSIVKGGSINIHPSMLPLYRGQHVINWAIINGESETGVTLHFLEETLDSGNIIAQKAVPIHFEDNAKKVHDRIYQEACFLLKKIITEYKLGKPLISKAQDSSISTFYNPRKPEDGRINWNQSSITIYNLIRALSKPWPGAFSYFKDFKIIIWNARIGNQVNGIKYGKVLNAGKDYISVSTIDNEIIITDYEILKNTDSENIFKIGDSFL